MVYSDEIGTVINELRQDIENLCEDKHIGEVKDPNVINEEINKLEDEAKQSIISWHETEMEKYAMEARIDELEHVDGYECYWTQIKDTPDIKTDIDIDERITQLSSQLTNKKKGTK
jgi:hypothetical protein